ncbi:MAG: CoA-binding protein [Euryarchaeota archaeon]|nr:CoA-binding protein [Euryarchaeota archaeon]|tara:strand:+ start:39200 stop:40582 length:1383 start_codon:yes stop_codon:yes gene_type:complete
MSSKNGIKQLFNPESIAVIGASHNPHKVGSIILKNLKEGGFTGNLYPINPDTSPILELKTYSSINRVRGTVDLAIISTPANTVPKILEDCGRSGVKAAVIISSGFKEIGEKGEKLEEELRKTIERHEITVVGPNCLGVYDVDSGIDSIFLPSYRMGRPKHGNISFISQSGAFGSALLDWSAEEGFGISKFVSYGNAIDVDEVALLEYLGNDKDTKVISMYLEGANRARDLIEVGKKVTQKKPVVCLKVGRTEAGVKAAASHTGSLAGSDEIYSAAFKQAGIIRAETIEEMFDYSRAFATQPQLKGKKIAIITDGGGFGVMAADSAEKHGLQLAELSKKTKKFLKKELVPYASLNNPIDLTGVANEEHYSAAIDACMADPKVDCVLVILLLQPPNVSSDVIETLIEINSQHRKPMLVCSAGGRYTKTHTDILEDSGIPVFPTPDRAAKAMATLYKYSKIKN